MTASDILARILATKAKEIAAAKALRPYIRVRVDADALPAPVVASLSHAMAMHDPGGDLQIQLNCPRCAHQWQALFDIVPYLWSALEDWAQRTLADVHLLARAYSWSEREILGLSATRRQHYVEMVRA